MTIEIIEPPTIIEGYRVANIIITQGGNSYLWSVGGLPLAGNLQTILDARESELFSAAAVNGKPVDLYEVTARRVLKAFALVMLDEINLLRQASVPTLPVRTVAQLENALKNKLKSAG